MRSYLSNFHLSNSFLYAFILDNKIVIEDIIQSLFAKLEENIEPEVVIGWKIINNIKDNRNLSK